MYSHTAVAQTRGQGAATFSVIQGDQIQLIFDVFVCLHICNLVALLLTDR
jgi:hypothetical protein